MNQPSSNEVDPFEYIDIIYGWDLPFTQEEFIFDGYHKLDALQYLEAVDEVQRLTDYGAVYGGTSVLDTATSRLLKEFCNILMLISSTNLSQPGIASSAPGSNTYTTDMSSSWGFHEEEYMNSHALDIELIRDLGKISERLKSAGYLGQCVHLFASARKDFLYSKFRGLGATELSICDMLYLHLDQMEKKTRAWIRASKACFQVFFIYEKQLCEQVFGRHNTVSDACFLETVKDVASKIFEFPEEASKLRDSVQRLFVILDIYNAFSEIVQQGDAVFGSERMSGSIIPRATQICVKLQNAIRRILSKFEHDVLHEHSPNPPPGSSKIHYFPIYVMSYLQRLLEYQSPLMPVIASMTLPPLLPSPQTPIIHEDIYGKTPFSVHLIWITTTLVSNLESKAKLYKDVLSGHLFLMNHLYYIANEIALTRQLRELIGDHYPKALIAEFQRNQAEYQRLALQKILYSLRDEESQMIGCFLFGRIGKRRLKERLSSFNATFQHVHRVLAKSMVTDTIVRHKLQESILDNLIPTYTSFLRRFKRHIKSSEHIIYIKYSATDLEYVVREFFPVHDMNSSRT